MRIAEGICLFAALFFAGHAIAQRQNVENYQPQTVLARPLPPITDAAFVSATQADVADSELVIGVVLNGESRAYPINQLTGPRREIINDTLGGTAIAATW